MGGFNKDAYDACDHKAKSAVRSYLDSKGMFTNITEDYGPDIQSWRKIYHEVEIKSSWEDEWPTMWSTVHIPYRKKKYMDGGRRVRMTEQFHGRYGRGLDRARFRGV